jgi:tRNA dimethylallyltransferase
MGPTGSGKSAMALAIARTRPTVIINADAMQMVRALRVLSARPSEDEEAAAEHALYGVLAADAPTSVALWLKLVEPVIARAWAEGKLPLLVGGTGMYVKALMEGLATVPPIPPEVRARVRAVAREELHSLLAAKDPGMAAQLKPGDTQRLLRALEVVEATGISLAIWQKQASKPTFPDAEFTSFFVDMPRDTVYANINQRFEKMMENGAVAEVEALLAQNLPADTPILRAHGVPEIAAMLAGTMTPAEAITRAQQYTRNYAKRQMTWIRNQMPDAIPVKAGSIPPEMS